MIRAVGLVMAKDLRRNLRNGFFVTMGIITPLALALVFNLVFGGTESGRLEIPVGWVDEDRSEASAELEGLLAQLDGDGLVVLDRLQPGTDPPAALADEDLRAVVVAPDGFGAAAAGRSGHEPELEVAADPDAPTSAGIVRAVVDQFAQGADRARIGAVAAASLGLDAPATTADPAVTLIDREADSRLDATAGIAAAMASLFLFLTALLGVTSILDERRDGTLARLLASPIPRSSVVVAKVLVSVILGVTSTMTLVVVMGLLLGADFGAPLGVVALVVAFSVTAAAFTLLVAGSARPAEPAQNVQSSMAVGLAALGGGLIPLPGPGLFDVLSRLTPHHWFLEGLRALGGGASWTAALPAVGVLLVFAVVLGGPGAVLAQRRLGV